MFGMAVASAVAALGAAVMPAHASPVQHWSDDYVLIDANPSWGAQWYADGDGLKCLVYGDPAPLVYCLINRLGLGVESVGD